MNKDELLVRIKDYIQTLKEQRQNLEEEVRQLDGQIITLISLYEQCAATPNHILLHIFTEKVDGKIENH